MDLSKSYDFFQPEKDTARVHIIGCGSVGSAIAENLVRCGVTRLSLWDFDTVEPKNIANQMFRAEDVGSPKVEALRDILIDINPEANAEIELHPEGWHGELLSGYLFLAVDSVELRRKIVETHKFSTFVKAVFDVRTGLTDAQTFAANWSDYKSRQSLEKTMQFSDEDAAKETPVSACGGVLGVVTTVRIISAFAVNNYIRFVKGEGFWKFLQLDCFTGNMEAYDG